MRELSLHIMDLVENAMAAGATVIEIGVERDPQADRLSIAVEDNGPGLGVPWEMACDPFYTTKPGKKTGLGLSLLRFRAEQAGGGMEVGRSGLGGLAVRASMRLSHVDRSPLGDLAATLCALVSAGGGLDLRLRMRAGDREWRVGARETAGELPAGRRGELAVARRMYEKVLEGLAILQIGE